MILIQFTKTVNAKSGIYFCGALVGSDLGPVFV